MDPFFTSFPEIAWPAIPNPYSAGLLATLFALERTQWWSPDELLSQQHRQLAIVLEHAHRTVPYYRRKFDDLGLNSSEMASSERWPDVPLLTRRDIQLSGNTLHSNDIPRTHGPAQSTSTSGSTNQPVVTLGTGFTDFYWNVLTLRDHFWHRRDFSQSLASIRYTGDNQAQPPRGITAPNWGKATSGTIATGPAHLLNIQSTLEEQAAWLRGVNPSYLLSYPSVLLALSRMFAANGWALPQLQELRTFGEILEPECRAECQRLLGVRVVDMYSSQEVGCIALQCPEHEHYHVQSENLLVEVLDESGRACQPGEIGRVVITTLHNFAMPLVRYDIGDYAEVGEPCSCGRGLPVLKRVLGRQRNLLVMPDGQRRWPLFDRGERPEELPPFFQFQVVQRIREQIDVYVVRHAAYSPQEEAILKRYFQQTLGHPFTIQVHCVDAIARNRTGKFEDFICQID